MAILDALRDWLTAQRRRLSAKNALAKAIQYALSRWDALTRYAGDGRLAIDNNVAERALRGIAITRKNFLFLGSDAGGERAAILYTVLESAKLNGLDPQTWLTDVIDRMANGHPINRLAELLPWNWQPKSSLSPPEWPRADAYRYLKGGSGLTCGLIRVSAMVGFGGAGDERQL